MAKILLAGIKHETNTFAKGKTSFEQFKERIFWENEEVISYFKNTKTECGGMLDSLITYHHIPVPVIMADSQPGGIVDTKVADYVCDKIKEKLVTEKIDAILLVLHGAMVLDSNEDGEGYILEKIRTLCPTIPIVATLDMHANLTEKMVQNANAFFAYDTYPHIDLYERGKEAADFLNNILNSHFKYYMKFIKLPIISSSLPTGTGIMHEIMTQVNEAEKTKGIISISFLQGFRLADIHDLSISIIAIAEEETLAENILLKLSSLVMHAKEKFTRSAVPVSEAVTRAITAQKGPIILADISDNPGSGAPEDGTQLLEELLRQKAQNAVVVLIKDAESIKNILEAGVNNIVHLNLGGKTEDEKLHGKPLQLTAKVKTICDSIFYNKGEMCKNMRIDLGCLAVVEVNGIEILISERRHQPYDPEILRRLGISPEDKKIIAVKSLAHFRAAYSKFAKEIIEVDLPGIAAVNPEKICYKNVRRPIYPLDK